MYILSVVFMLSINFILIKSEEAKSFAINSCGMVDNDKSDYSQPSRKEDCADPDEPYCKFITLKNKHTGAIIKHYCAPVHGKYNDVDVHKYFEDTTGFSVSIESSRFFSNKINIYIISVIFYLLLL